MWVWSEIIENENFKGIGIKTMQDNKCQVEIIQTEVSRWITRIITMYNPNVGGQGWDEAPPVQWG